MKKIFLALSVCVAFTLVSCKKDRTCTCTTSSSAGGGATTYEITVLKAKKSDVKKMCVKTTEVSNGYTITNDCKLK